MNVARLARQVLTTLALGLALGTASTVMASAGTVVGSVPLKPSDLSVYPVRVADYYVGRSNKCRTAQASDTTYGVAYVTDVLAVPERALPHALLDQACHRFVPRILAIEAGQTVEFRNSDTVYHNIFSYSPSKRFDLGRYPRGQSKLVAFPKAGAIQVYCDIHSEMRADIIVVPGPYFAYVDNEGRFRIENVPAGTHTVAVWLPSGGERRGTVTVRATGQSEVSFPSL
jgi:plastocyanin